MSTEEMLLIDYHVKLKEKRWMDYIADLLGVHWSRDEMIDNEVAERERGGRPPDHIFTPLTHVINHRIVDVIKASFGLADPSQPAAPGKSGQPYIAGGTFIPPEGSVILPMDAMPKDQFKKIVGAE